MFLKRFAPKSLYARFLLIIIIPTVVAQLVAMYMFFERHWKSVSTHMSASLSGEIALVTKEFSEAKSQEKRNALIQEARHFLGLRVVFLPEIGLPKQKCAVGAEYAIAPTKCLPREKPRAFELLQERLEQRLGHPFLISLETDTSDIMVQVELPEGLLAITATNKRLTNPTTSIFIMWMSGTAFILLIIAIMFLRNQVRSITRLAKAAEKFGKGEDVEDFKPYGAKEVRQAAMSFLEMKERIQRHMSQRMEMLGGISHDLRTPLTRMKLQLAMLDKSDTTKQLGKDVEEMEMMVNEYLDYMRGTGREEKQEVRLGDLLEDIVGSYDKSGENISLRVEKNSKARLRPLAFKRCITNIINNAIKFGSRVVVNAEVGKKKIKIAIDDNGPGIPKEKYDEVFRPFVKLDTSRGEKSGGAGLGLSIVRDIVTSDGGEVHLEESALGGLRVVITLPL